MPAYLGRNVRCSVFRSVEYSTVIEQDTLSGTEVMWTSWVVAFRASKLPAKIMKSSQGRLKIRYTSPRRSAYVFVTQYVNS